MPIFSLKSDALNKTHLLCDYNNYNIENLTNLVIFKKYFSFHP